MRDAARPYDPRIVANPSLSDAIIRAWFEHARMSVLIARIRDALA